MSPDYYTCATFVYRCFAADGTLLYVGMSGNLDARLKLHSYTKSWWGEVARIATEEYPQRSQAGVAERCAIRDEHPAHNAVPGAWRKARAAAAKAATA